MKLAHAGESLMEILEVLELIPYSRLRGASPEGRADLVGDRGAGTCHPGPLIAERIDLPTELTEFDPSPYLCFRSLQVFTFAMLLMAGCGRTIS